jgi:hypothetical protein
MATISHSTTILTPQTPPGSRGDPFAAGRFRSSDACCTVADVRDRAARVRTWRDRVWPSLPPRLAEPPAPQRAPVAQPVAMPPALPARSDVATGRTSVREVIHVTAKHFNMTVDDLLSHRRFQPLVRRRWVVMYVAHKLTGRSLVFIARKMRRSDHTTIMNGIRCMTALLENGDGEMVDAVNAIVEKLTGGVHE